MLAPVLLVGKLERFHPRSPQQRVDSLVPATVSQARSPDEPPQAKSNLLLSDRCSAANVYEITKQVADVTRQDLPWKSHEI